MFCPKHMTYGPCGGVRASGECEIGGLACPFVSAPLPVWSAPKGGSTTTANPAALRLRASLARGQAVVGDLPARPLDSASLRECAATLADIDAVLLGDSPRDRTQFPPAHRAGLVQAAGASAWVVLNTRDRNRVALEAELAACVDLGVGAVHCVTGDHPSGGGRPDAAAVFDLDSTQLAALAAGRGQLVSVAESPAAPPRDRRPARLLSKERAGADVCFVNHCGGVAPVASFVRACRSLGATVAMVACVPLVCDAGGAALLASLHSPGLEPRELDRILAAEDPRAVGIGVAAEHGRRMLDTGLLSGVNLSGGPAPGHELAYAEALAETAAALAR